MAIQAAPQARPWWAAILLALLAAALDAPAITHDYVFDDSVIVRYNPVVTGHHYLDAVTTPYWPPAEGRAAAANWRPLAIASLTLEHHLLGSRARHLHHLVNAGVHGLVVLALFPLACRLCGPRWGVAACALFAVHPAHVEAVAPIVGRCDLIAALGTLVALECYLRFRDGRGGAWLAAGAAAWLVGLGGKESAAPLLAILPAADWLLGGRRLRDLAGRTALAWLPFVAVAAVYVAARAAVLGGHSFAHGGAVAYSWLDRVVFMARNTVVSAGLLVGPVRFHHVLTTLPGSAPITYPDPHGVAAVGWLAGAAAIGLGWIGLVRRAPRAAFAWLAALLAWAPTSGLLPAAAGVSLRFLFLPAAFYACGLGVGLHAIAAARPAWRKPLGWVVAMLVLGGAGVSLWRQAAWRNDGTFYAAVLRERPDCHTAHYSLGTWLSTRRPPDLDGARQHYEAAVRAAGTGTESFEARLNLAMSWTLGTTGEPYTPGCDLDEAQRQLEQMIELFPDRWEPYLNLGLLLDRRGDRGAAAYLRRVLELYPEYPQRDELERRIGR